MIHYDYYSDKYIINYPLFLILCALLLVAIIGIVFLFKYAKDGERDDMVSWRKRIGWPLCEVLSLCVTILSMYFAKEFGHSTLLVLFFICFIIAGLISTLFCYTYFDDLNDKSRKLAIAKAAAAERTKQKEIFDRQLAELDSKYGKHTTIINYGNWCDIKDQIIVFEDKEIVIIKSREYHFSDILGCKLDRSTTRETITSYAGASSTSTPNMLGRAVVGGVLTGGLGAAAGAVTAKRKISIESESITKTKHAYAIYISINSVSNPLVTLRIGDYASCAHKIEYVLNAIANKNNKQ